MAGRILSSAEEFSLHMQRCFLRLGHPSDIGVVFSAHAEMFRSILSLTSKVIRFLCTCRDVSMEPSCT